MGSSRGLTLIEILIVLGLIGTITSFAVIAINPLGQLAKARDAKRKVDLANIKKTLELYYNDNNRYPQAGVCAYGSNCYVFSYSGSNWIPALVPNYVPTVPVDPRNNGTLAPWTDNHYLYSYGNVSTDGQHYDLTMQLENKADPDRCQIKQYVFYFDNRPWCGPNSQYLYEASPD